MALRPIDNALPTTPERPRKQSKISVPIAKQSVNNENQAPLQGDAAIDYISSEDLKPMMDPEARIQVS